MRSIDIVGQRFGRWTVLEQLPNKKCLCLCDCGTQNIVNKNNLRLGHSKSCGCYRDEKATRHGHAKVGKLTPTYHSWAGMKARCMNPNHVKFSDYGARGIIVCERWMDFDNFVADMDERPVGTTINRIDNDGIYEKDNCEWATMQEQARNRRPRRRAGREDSSSAA